MREPETRVVGYLRVSTNEQGQSGAGLEAQRRAIVAECERRGWELVRIEEDVQSGRSTRRRPGLARAIEACASGEANGVIAYSASRLSRSVVDFGRLLERAEAEGWNVVALDLGVDLSTASGRLVANVMIAASQWEREVCAERTRAALAVRRAQGVRLGRPESIPPALAARIRHMRHRDGMTLQAICDRLDAEGVATARGGARWRPGSLQAVLRGDKRS
jgi:DNA invertase Pin-like site-specific DNA recombinase